jgi:hypothetical protein
MRDESRVIGIGPEDVERAAALHLRCSVHTLWSRYHRAMGDPRSHPRTLLTRLGSAPVSCTMPVGSGALLRRAVVCCRAAHDGYVNSLKRHAVGQPAPVSLADGRVFIGIGRSWTCPAS